MFPSEKAIIDVCDNLYIARTLRGDVIAISDCIDVVTRRVKYAQPNVLIYVLVDDEEYTLKRYEAMIAPVIYRLSYSNSEKTGEIAVLDYIKNGKYSDVMLFNSTEKAAQFVRKNQADNGHYYVHAWRRSTVDFGGLDWYELTDQQKNTSRISKALKEERARRNKRLSEADA